MGGLIGAAVDAEDDTDVGKEDKSHELELANSLPVAEVADKSWTAPRVGVESIEFSDPDKIPAEPAVPLVGLSCCCWCCCWLAAAMPNKVDIKALPAAIWSAPGTCTTPEAGLGVEGDTLDLSFEAHDFPVAPEVPLPEVFELTTHFRMCFSKVEATLKGMAQNLHL